MSKGTLSRKLHLIFPFEVSAIQIFVKKIDSENIILEVESSDTIEMVKEKIYQVDNAYLPEKQKLIFRGKEMENGRTLADYDVQKDGTIHLQLVINKEKYKVIFDSNGGKFDESEQYVIEEWNNDYYDNLVKPTREGYTFKGYYTEKIGGTKFELILAESGIDSDMIFYAQWEENSVVIPSIPEEENSAVIPEIPEEENPKTFDDFVYSILMLSVSIIGLIGIAIFLKKKNKTIV